jgi:hypothetical protein
VIGTEDQDVLGSLVVHQVQALVDRVGRAREPARADPLLRRYRRDVVAEQCRHPPGRGDVPVEAVVLVLRQHHDLQEAGIHQIREHEVDQPVDAAERHGRLGPVGCKWQQPGALTACENDPERTPSVCHDRNLPAQRPWRNMSERTRSNLFRYGQ